MDASTSCPCQEGASNPRKATRPSLCCERTVLSDTLSVNWWRSWKRTAKGTVFGVREMVLFVVLLLLPTQSLALGYDIVHQSNTVILSDELDSQSFHGNSSHVDYFRLLQRDGDSLLIGARNIVYNISITDLAERFDQRMVWNARKADSDLCFLKGKSESECHNYIRVLAKKDEGELLVCGTNAYKPLCRDYSLQPNGTFTYIESSGTAKCPYNPRHNSTFVYADGDLYSGTAGDFMETLSLIYREPLRTELTDYNQLNAPNFVHSFSYDDYVFFFFREVAVEYMNCGKRIYSRVARVCKNDRGRRDRKSYALWTSFLKSRLNCSVSGDFPFYFDEIQSVTDVIEGTYGGVHNEVIYAIFTTPQNSIPGSAICSFSMRDILDTFEGPFKEQKDRESNWLAVPPHKVPVPRPGTCVNDSQTLPDATTNFILSHPLMDNMVPSHQGRPLLMKASFNFRFTKLAVDAQVPISTGEFVDVIFIATDSGIILKTFSSHVLDEGVNSPIVEEIHVFESPVSINNLQVAKQANGEAKVILITDSEVRAIPLHRCDRAKSCGECISLQDPYCGWYPNLGVCDSFQSSSFEDEVALQNVSSGYHSSCPYNDDNFIRYNPSTQTYSTGHHPIASDEDLPLRQENQIDSSRLNTQEIDYLNNIIPKIPYGRSRHPSYRSQEARSAKELSAGEGPRHIDDILIAYSEGVSGPVVSASREGPLIYSAETLAIAVTTACVAALVVGFISGFLFSRRCRGDDYPPFSETPHLDSKLKKCDNLAPSADPNMYTANNTTMYGAKHINNLVTNYNPKNINTGKSNTNTTTDNKLLKPAKCAYI